MLNHISPTDISNEISMTRSVFDGTFLIVEGSTDSRLYGKFVSDDVKVIVAHNKDNVIKVVKKSNGRGDDGVIGIIDRDLEDKSQKNIFSTDLRDAEAMMIDSPALDAVLAEYGSQEKMMRFSNTKGMSVREAIFRSAAFIGNLMLLSKNEGLGLSFKDPAFDDFVLPDLEVDVKKLIDDAYRKASSPKGSKTEVSKELLSRIGRIDDKRISRGHDCVSILRIGLVRNFGSYNCKRLNDDVLGGTLRIAYSFDMFRDTDLYRRSSEWAHDHEKKLWHSL